MEKLFKRKKLNRRIGITNIKTKEKYTKFEQLLSKKTLIIYIVNLHQQIWYLPLVAHGGPPWPIWLMLVHGQS
jgi:hypothetical protein